RHRQVSTKTERIGTKCIEPARRVPKNPGVISGRFRPAPRTGLCLWFHVAAHVLFECGAAAMSGIIKRQRKHHFAIIPNAVLEDRRLSGEARGVLAYLLSRPPDWETRPSHLRHMFSCGKERMDRIMRELIDAGYAGRVVARLGD